MRRLAPRPAAFALEAVKASLAPATTLARVQAAWPSVVGETVAQESQAVSERAGVVTIACRSAVWSQELALMAPELADRLNAALAEDSGRARVAELRFQVTAPKR
jgi:predicted nucleic acid-binding Zn ribbon protein